MWIDIGELKEKGKAAFHGDYWSCVLASFLQALCASTSASFPLNLFVFHPLEIGCTRFFLCNTQEHTELDALGHGFTHNYWRSVGTIFLRNLFVVLWSLLFLIPGIIKGYSYRLVPYILADDPTIGAMDAIDLSREMMDGRKWNAFVLDLSFIGWVFLALITCGLAGILYAGPYKAAVDAEFYLSVRNDGFLAESQPVGGME